MDNTIGNLSVQPHVIEVGEKLTASWAGDSPASANQWDPTFAGLEAIADCTGKATCTYKAVAPTEGWARLNFNRPGGGVEQDYYGIVAVSTGIEGTVVDSDGDGLAGVQLQAKRKGGGGGRARTDDEGSYKIEVKKGTYVVKPKLAGTDFKPADRTVKVPKAGVATADFRALPTCSSAAEARSDLRRAKDRGSCKLKVVVRSWEGKRVVGARVDVRPQKGRRQEGATGRNGSATFKLDAGEIYGVFVGGPPKDPRPLYADPDDEPENGMRIGKIRAGVDVIGGTERVEFKQTPKCQGEFSSRFGTDSSSGPDTITGTGKDDVINTLEPYLWSSSTAAGTDTVDAGAGDDLICGVGGLNGGAGRDRIESTLPAGVRLGNGADVPFEPSTGRYLTVGVYGGGDRDDISVSAIPAHGGPGDDRLNGSAKDAGFGNRDRLYGDEGDDTLTGGRRPDVIVGGEGDDDIFGGDGGDAKDPQLLSGGPGNDTVRGGDGVDYASGDLLRPHMSSDSGDDTLWLSLYTSPPPRTDKDAIFGKDGDDTLFGARDDDFIDGGTGHDRLAGEEGRDECKRGEIRSWPIYPEGGKIGGCEEWRRAP